MQPIDARHNYKIAIDYARSLAASARMLRRGGAKEHAESYLICAMRKAREAARWMHRIHPRVRRRLVTTPGPGPFHTVDLDGDEARVAELRGTVRITFTSAISEAHFTPPQARHFVSSVLACADHIEMQTPVDLAEIHGRG